MSIPDECYPDQVLTVYRSLLLLGVFLLVREVKEEPKKRKVRRCRQRDPERILFEHLQKLKKWQRNSLTTALTRLETSGESKKRVYNNVLEEVSP